MCLCLGLCLILELLSTILKNWIRNQETGPHEADNFPARIILSFLLFCVCAPLNEIAASICGFVFLIFTVAICVDRIFLPFNRRTSQSTSKNLTPIFISSLVILVISYFAIGHVTNSIFAWLSILSFIGLIGYILGLERTRCQASHLKNAFIIVVFGLIYSYATCFVAASAYANFEQQFNERTFGYYLTHLSLEKRQKPQPQVQSKDSEILRKLAEIQQELEKG